METEDLIIIAFIVVSIIAVFAYFYLNRAPSLSVKYPNRVITDLPTIPLSLERIEAIKKLPPGDAQLEALKAHLPADQIRAIQNLPAPDKYNYMKVILPEIGFIGSTPVRCNGGKHDQQLGGPFENDMVHIDDKRFMSYNLPMTDIAGSVCDKFKWNNSPPMGPFKTGTCLSIQTGKYKDTIAIAQQFTLRPFNNKDDWAKYGAPPMVAVTNDEITDYKMGTPLTFQNGQWV